MMINDLPSIINYNIELYADDTTISTQGHSTIEVESNLQEAANNLSRWCNENQMAIDCIKTKESWFLPNITLDNHFYQAPI